MQAKPEVRVPLQHLEKLDSNRENIPQASIKQNVEKKHVMAPPEKKKRENLSALCKTPPSTIKGRGKDFKRGLCLGKV